MRNLHFLASILKCLAGAAAGVLFTGCGPSDEVLQLQKQSEQFFAENAKKPGVQTTASGLQYEVQQPGQGAKPLATSTVTVNYRGMFISGEEFDAGEGTSFPLNGVIAGWTEGLQLMQEGAKYKFYVPPELGYGEAGAGGVIPPYSPLIFEVELVKVGS